MALQETMKLEGIIGIVGPVSNQTVILVISHQVLSLRDVVSLSGGQPGAYRDCPLHPHSMGRGVEPTLAASGGLSGLSAVSEDAHAAHGMSTHLPIDGHNS